MVVLTPTTTRRGKIVYTEVDAAPYYQTSDEGESPKRKPSNIPSHTTTTVPASLEDTVGSKTIAMFGGLENL